MNPRIIALLAIILSGMLLAVVVEWRTATRFREENLELRRAKQEVEENFAQAGSVAAASAEEAAAEARHSVQEVATLRSELQAVRQELERANALGARSIFNYSGSSTGLQTGGIRFQPSLLQAQSPPGTPTSSHLLPDALARLGAQSREGTRYHDGGGQIDGVRLFSTISKESALSGPDWTPSQPLPLSFAAAEEIARAELRKLVQDEQTWFVRSVSLEHSEVNPQKWHYLVGLRAAFGSDYLMVNVGMTGTPGTTIISDRTP